MPRYKEHEYYREIIKSQHKCFTGGYGIGKGYGIYLNQEKAAYTATKLNKQKINWKQGRGEHWNGQKKR